MLIHLLEMEANYFIEGDGILPKHMAELIEQYPKEVKSCFVEFSEADVNQKLRNVRGFAGKSDWTDKVVDAELTQNIKKMIKFSNYLKNECSKYNISYFDSSNENFNEYLERVFQYLVI